MSRSRQRVQGTLNALCDLREAEATSKKCEARADRSLDMVHSYKERDHLRLKCRNLTRRLHRLQMPFSCTKTLRNADNDFLQGRLAVTASPDKDEIKGLAVIAPGWRVVSQRIVDLTTIKKVLAYLEKRVVWRRMKLKTSPHPAVPRFISTDDGHATLQNLPVWQSTRITLLSCAMHNRAQGGRAMTERELSRLVQDLDVSAAYHSPLESLRNILHAQRKHQTPCR